MKDRDPRLIHPSRGYETGRFALPNPFAVVVGGRTGDPFLSDRQIDKNLSNQERIFNERNVRVQGSEYDPNKRT